MVDGSRREANHRRRRLKWAGFVASLSTACLYVAISILSLSMGRVANGHDPSRSVLQYAVLGRGCLEVYLEPSDRQRSWNWFRDVRFETGCSLRPDGRLGEAAWLRLPLWITLSLVGVPTAFLFWRDCRSPRRTNACPDCGYDLAGLSQGPCPECGAGR